MAETRILNKWDGEGIHHKMAGLIELSDASIEKTLADIV